MELYNNFEENVHLLKFSDDTRRENKIKNTNQKQDGTVKTADSRFKRADQTH